jgi:16S rRNA processing protein RimM
MPGPPPAGVSSTLRWRSVAAFKGVITRDDAARINGIELYIPRDRLPDTEDGEYYHADLIGLRAIDARQQDIGKVAAIHNFGAGDIIEIAPPRRPSLLLPFTDAVVPTVDLNAGHVVVDLPQEIDGDEPDNDTTPQISDR